MRITYACPACDATVTHAEVESARVARLPALRRRRSRCPPTRSAWANAAGGRRPSRAPGTAGAPAVPRLPEHASCFARKDFPQRLGVGIVVVGFAASCVTWAWQLLVPTFAILFATAAVDVLLYFLMPECLTCYRCGARYRGAGGPARRLRPRDPRAASAAADPAAPRLPPAERPDGTARLLNCPTPSRRTPATEAEQHGSGTGADRGRPAGRRRRRCPLRRRRPRSLYATDGSLFEQWPLAVVRPRSTDDVAATVRWAAEQGISVHARGAAARASAAAPLGAGHRDRLLAVHAAGAGVSRGTGCGCSPGVVAGQLDAILARRRRTFGPDPANAAVSTLGGMIGRDASGQPLSAARLDPRSGGVGRRSCSPMAR